MTLVGASSGDGLLEGSRRKEVSMKLCFASCVVFLFAAGLTRGDDCNKNGAEDAVDISEGASADCNRNGIPDDCELGAGLPFGYAEAGGVPDVNAAALQGLDIDSDGDLDVAGASHRGIDIIASDGGALRLLQHLEPPGGAGNAWGTVLAHADMDRDGDLDIILTFLAYPPVGALFLLRNEGDGTFGDPAHLHAVEEPRFVVASELDGDGAADLLTNRRSEGLIIFTGAGGEETLLVPGLSALNSVAAGDPGGDGDNDIFFAGQIDDVTGLFTMENRGSGSFGEPVTLAAEFAEAIQVLDADGDLDLDLVNLYGFLLNDGTGSFKETVAFPEWREPADLDGDGDLDLLRGHRRTIDDHSIEGFHGISIRLNTGGKTFDPPVAFPTGARIPMSSAVLELNGDGRPDLVAGTADDNPVSPGVALAAFLNVDRPYHQGDADRNGVLDLCESFHRGDVDSSGVINITDPIRLFNYLFHGVGEISCLEAADGNNDGSADISDAIFILAFNFTGGRRPPPPGPPDLSACGKDPEGGDLGCTSYTGCGDFGS
jgi:hypothetical protein